MRALVGFGGNQGGERAVRERFRYARAELAQRDYVTAVRASPIYRTEPVGALLDQPAFINAVVELAVSDQPPATRILADLLAIEAELGRDRRSEIAKGPRPIDLDLLIVDGLACDLPGPPPLTLPHPRLGERAFVLAPLAALVGPGFVVAPGGSTLGDLLADVDVAAQAIELIARDW